MNEQPNKPKGRKVTGFLEDKGFYIILFLCVVAIGITGYVFFFSDPVGTDVPVSDTDALIDALSDWEDPNGPTSDPLPVFDGTGDADTEPDVSVSADDDAVPAGSIDGQDADAVETGKAKTDVKSEAPKSEAPKSEASKTEAPKSEAPKSEAPKSGAAGANFFVRPVAGRVIQEFSGEELVFNPTMKDWRTHNGADFEAADGEQVVAIADGTVADVYTDSYFGTCVLLDHGGGLQSMYAGLIENASVKKGQTVTAGTVIGAVDGSALFEASLPVHLHIEVMRDGKRIDPLSVIPS